LHQASERVSAIELQRHDADQHHAQNNIDLDENIDPVIDTIDLVVDTKDPHKFWEKSLLNNRVGRCARA